MKRDEEEREIIEEVYYSQKELTRILNVSRATLLRWRKEGRLPEPVQINGLDRYSSFDIKKMVDHQNPDRCTDHSLTPSFKGSSNG